jgi:hypothetical protein
MSDRRSDLVDSTDAPDGYVAVFSPGGGCEGCAFFTPPRSTCAYPGGAGKPGGLKCGSGRKDKQAVVFHKKPATDISMFDDRTLAKTLRLLLDEVLVNRQHMIPEIGTEQYEVNAATRLRERMADIANDVVRPKPRHDWNTSTETRRNPWLNTKPALPA